MLTVVVRVLPMHTNYCQGLNKSKSLEANEVSPCEGDRSPRRENAVASVSEGRRCRLEFEPRSHLDVARAAYRTVPYSELGTGDIVGEGYIRSSVVPGGIEDMPVPQIEELSADLEVQFLGDL